MTPYMEVTHASFSRLGGAGAVAVRLSAAQARLGWQSNLVTLVDTPFPRWAGRHPIVAASALADYYWVRQDTRSSFFSLFRRQHCARIARDTAQPKGVLHLHWLPGLFWPPAFFSQPLQARRCIWSIPDLWPFTGGCHYANGCQRFTTTCADCPQVRRPFRRSVAAALRAKWEALGTRRDLLLVAPSEWTRTLIRSSLVMRDLPVTVIPNPVDTRVFSPRDKTAVRREWGVDSETFVVGVGAADLRDERKQIPQTLGVLRDWMRRRQGRGSVQVLIFGAGGPLPGFPSAFRFLGPSRNASSLAEWYNAMDVYVSLSRFETFGNTLAEAAACGVPSVCITGSGMAEVVVPGQTGRHVNAPEELPEALADWVENPAQARRVGMEARTHAVRRFNDEVIARQFITLYGEPHS